MDTVARPDAVILLVTADAERVFAVPGSRGRPFAGPPPRPAFPWHMPIPVAFRAASSAGASGRLLPREGLAA